MSETRAPEEAARLLAEAARSLGDGQAAAALAAAEGACTALRAGGDRAAFAEGLGLRVQALSALGRHEEALEVARERVGLRWTLAQPGQATGFPELAWAIHAVACELALLDRWDEAQGYARDATRIAVRLWQLDRHASGELAEATLRIYRSCCRELGQEPDPEVLGPFAPCGRAKPRALPCADE